MKTKVEMRLYNRDGELENVKKYKEEKEEERERRRRRRKISKRLKKQLEVSGSGRKGKRVTKN